MSTVRAVTDVRPRRLDAASAFPAAALLLTGFALAGAAPEPAEPAGELARHLAENRTRILIGDVLIGAGAGFYVWFLAALASRLQGGARRERTLAVVVLAAGVQAMGVVVAGAALQAGLVLDGQTLTSDAVVRLGFDSYNALVTLAGFGFAATVAATAGSAARTGALPRSLRLIAWPTALLQVLTIRGLAATGGPFAPGRAVAIGAFWALTAWSLAVAVFLIRSDS